AGDWAYLCRQMASDLRRTAPAALADLARLRELVVRAKGARLYVIGSRETQEAIAGDLERLVGALGPGPAAAAPAAAAASAGQRRFIEERLRARRKVSGAPVFVGLVNPSTQSGVFVHTAPATSYLDTGEEELLDYLASN